MHLANLSQIRSREASPYRHAPSFSIPPPGLFVADRYAHLSCMYADNKTAYILGEHDGSAQKLGWPGSRYRYAVSLHTSKRLHTNPEAVDKIAASQSRLIENTLRNSRTDENFTVLISEVRRFFHFVETLY
jgi:hypothetical protein